MGPLLDELTRRQDRGEAVAVIVSSDHGEEFVSHRFHGHSVSDRVAHIPLLLVAPGFVPRRTRALASSVDVFPTVLSLSKVPLPDDLDGRDLTPVLRGDVDDWSRVVFTDGWVYDSSDRLQSNQVMATDGKARLTVNLINMAEELLDVSRERTGARQENLLGTLDDTGPRVPLHLYLDRATTVPPQN